MESYKETEDSRRKKEIIIQESDKQGMKIRLRMIQQVWKKNTYKP